MRFRLGLVTALALPLLYACPVRSQTAQDAAAEATAAADAAFLAKQYGSLNKLMAKFQDNDGNGNNREQFQTLYGKFDPIDNGEDNFIRTQDSHLLDWNGWRFVTMPFDSAFNRFSGDPGYPEANRPLKWISPFYIEKAYDLENSLEITGIRYIADLN